MSELVLIGVDHGYAAMKTAHFSFPTGLVQYEYEPYTTQNVLEYDGKYYVTGTGRQPLQKDKTATDDYFLLTLAAIAKEIEFHKMEHNITVRLAAGLPLTSFGRDKKKFQEYLIQNKKPVNFRFENAEYCVSIADVMMFPQGYSAVLTQTGLLDEPSVIVADIGGWTVDLMRLDNRIPNAATCRSLELGIIRCLDEISEQLRRTLGLSMTAVQIENVLHGGVSNIAEQAKELICREADLYIQNLFAAITESGLDIRAMPVIFLGGGAALIKRHVPPADAVCRVFILDDVCLNAKGYEHLAAQVLRSTMKNE